MIILKRYYLHLFFLITIGIAFSHNHSMSLWDQDEAAYAGFAKNMIQSDNWLVPDFMWSEIHRKPPLHFWNIALSYKVFGINEFSVRFSSTLFIIFTYLLIYFWGGKLFDKKISFISAVVLSTTLFVPVLAKVAVTDATLLFFTTVCAFSILSVLKRINYKAIAVFWISFAIALLIKGPPIIILCATLAIILFIFHPNRKNLFRFYPWFFLPLAFLPLFIWGYLAFQKDNGNLINWMIDWYILKRINGSVLGQSGPPGTHFLLLTVFFIPYFMFFPKALWTGIVGIVKNKNENLLLGAWFVAGWLLYEFSPSKLPAYCVAAHVPLAILIGKTIVFHLKENIKPHKALIIIQFSLIVIIVSALIFVSFFMDLSVTLKWSLIIFAILMITGIIVALKLTKTSNFVSLVLGLNLFFQIIMFTVILPQIDIYKNSTKRVSYFIRNNAVKESIIILANKTGKPPSLPYYASLYFDNIIWEEDIELMFAQYESKNPYVFVLNEKQKNQFKEIYPLIEIQKISSFSTDRKGQANYYIAQNALSKK